MPTIEFDISDQVANLIDTAIQSGGPDDFNPGQQTAWSAVECTINTATLTVYIAGREAEVTVNVDVRCSGADYISEAVAQLEETANNIGQSVADILDVSSYIADAYDQL